MGDLKVCQQPEEAGQAKSQLLFGIHCHQPVDNFNHVVQKAIEVSYRPFFEVVRRYPSFRFAVHYSGWLLDFIKHHDAVLWGMMKEAAEQGQIEFFTGGFYEPILASIPSVDRIGQICKLSDYIDENFGQRPRGLWLTERVWESGMIADLKKAGVEYLLVDDYHFLRVGHHPDELSGFFLTEEGGEEIAIYPISKELRYKIPFWQVSEAHAAIKSKKTAILFDDGEKFGLWPTTAKLVYEEGWLARFVEGMIEGEQIEAITFAEHFDRSMPVGLCYLPTASYAEMGEWSLPSDEALKLEEMTKMLTSLGDELPPFLGGSGIWKHFLVKYPESNRLHKRMIELSRRAGEDSQARELIWRAQANDVFWHGIFGGLYLPNLRDNAWRYLIMADDLLSQKRDLICVPTRFMMDGSLEYKVTTPSLFMAIEAACGGWLCELSLRDRGVNWLATLARRPESYHHYILEAQATTNKPEQPTTEATTIHERHYEVADELREEIVYDPHPCYGFIDHLLPPETTMDGVASRVRNGSILRLVRHEYEGNRLDFWLEGDGHQLHKEYRLMDQGLMLGLRGTLAQPSSYMCEFHLHLAEPQRALINGVALLEADLIDSQFVWEDPFSQAVGRLSFSRPARLKTFAIQSVSQSEAGFELTMQSVMLLFSWACEDHIKIDVRLEVVA
ncbi:MAG: DUF1926 domain-containing protein [Campylobacterales bacterium]